MGKADNILNKISEYQRELVKIQNNCGHTKKEIKFIKQKEGVRWNCNECKMLIGWPTDFELKK